MSVPWPINPVGSDRYRQPYTVMINNQPVRFRDVEVHQIRLSDVEDPDIWVADHIYLWQKSDAGKFVMEHAQDQPYWVQHVDHVTYGYIYRIMARLSEQNETYWRLRWGGLKK